MMSCHSFNFSNRLIGISSCTSCTFGRCAIDSTLNRTSSVSPRAVFENNQSYFALRHLIFTAKRWKPQSVSCFHFGRFRFYRSVLRKSIISGEIAKLVRFRLSETMFLLSRTHGTKMVRRRKRRKASTDETAAPTLNSSRNRSAGRRQDKSNVSR